MSVQLETKIEKAEARVTDLEGQLSYARLRLKELRARRKPSPKEPREGA